MTNPETPGTIAAPEYEKCPLCDANPVSGHWTEEDTMWMCGSRRWAPSREAEQSNECRIRELEARPNHILHDLRKYLQGGTITATLDGTLTLQVNPRIVGHLKELLHKVVERA